MSLEDEMALPMGGLSAAKIGKTYEDLQRQYGEAAKSNQALFAAAMERLRDDRVGPTTAEKLFAISSALSRPTRTGKFVETLGNVGSVMGAQEAEKRKAQMERAAMLEKYGMAQSAATLEDLKTRLAGAQRMYQTGAAAETAANKPRYMAVPPGGSLININTLNNENFGATPTPEAVAALMADPSLAQYFDEKYGSGAAARYLGGQ